MQMTTDNNFNVTQILPKDEVYGYNAAWKISKMIIELPELRQRFDDCDLDSSVLPKKIQVRSTVIRALADLEADGFIRRVQELETRTEAVFILAGEVIDTVNGKVRVEFPVEQTFTYNKGAGIVACEDPAIQTKVADLMHKHSTAMMPRNISLAVKSLVKRAGSVSWFPGVHFVPVAQTEVLDKLQKLFDTFGGAADLTLFSVPSTGKTGSQNASQLLRSFEKEYISELEDMIQDVDDLTAGSEDADRKRAVPAKSWLNRLDAFKLQKKKAQMFAEMLNFQAEDYIERIAAAELKLKDKLTSVG